MEQYINKAKVVAEIKKRLSLLEGGTGHPEVIKQVEGVIKAYRSILSFLDTIETKEMNWEKEIDLKKEIKDYSYALPHSKTGIPGGWKYSWPEEEVIKIASHFYELGLRAKDVNEIIKTAEDHAYFAGSENTRKKLIDKACEWLLNNVGYYSTNALGAEYMCEDFRKAMEE